MSLESSSFKGDISPQEAAVLYESLPAKMKTGYYGIEPQGKTFFKKEDAGDEAVPYVVVTFADGRRISLHLTHKNDLSFEEQAQSIKLSSLEDQNITDIQLVWQSASI
jgi:hypothetical protein